MPENFIVIANRDRPLVLWTGAALMILAALWFGRPEKRFDIRTPPAAQEDPREQMRLTEALRRVNERVRREAAARSPSVPLDLVAPVLAQKPVEQAMATSPLNTLSLVILQQGGRRSLLVADRLYRVGEQLPDGSTLMAIRERAIELRLESGERRVYVLGTGETRGAAATDTRRQPPAAGTAAPAALTPPPAAPAVPPRAIVPRSPWLPGRGTTTARHLDARMAYLAPREPSPADLATLDGGFERMMHSMRPSWPATNANDKESLTHERVLL